MESREWYYKDSNDEWTAVTWTELQDRFREGVVAADTLVTWKELGEPGFPFRYVGAEYLFPSQGAVWPAYSEAELHNAALEGKFSPSAQIWGRALPPNGITYASLQSIDVAFVPDIREFIGSRKGQPTTVLSGANNSGKTLMLKLLRKEFGPAANLLACGRFYHMVRLNPTSDQSGQYVRRHDAFVFQLYQQNQNTENSDFPLEQVISQMKDTQRAKLLTLSGEMLGAEFRLKQSNPENVLSERYIAVEGENLAITSTGTRLVLMLIAACLDDHFSILLIDEPELGLSPRLQTALARVLYCDDLRRTHFPHIRQLFVATHSHLFLDRAIHNNFVVTRAGSEISVKQVDSMSTYHDLQFNMLGNSLEALFLPAAIVIVEGPTDYEYTKRLFQVFLADHRISVVKSTGEGDTINKLRIINDTLGGLMKSPYRERVFILLDSRHSVRMRNSARYGVPAENVIVLGENGIEYYYPLKILAEVFACGETDVLSSLEIGDNTVKIHGIELSKTQLCDLVVARLSTSSKLPEELTAKLLTPVEQLVRLAD